MRLPAVTAFALAAVALGQNDDSPTWGYSNSRLGKDPSSAVLSGAKMKELWSVSSQGAVTAQPLVITPAGGSPVVIVASEMGIVQAVSLFAGTVLWKQSVGATLDIGCQFFPQGHYGVSSTPVYDSVRNLIYVLGGTGNFYALKVADGSVKFRINNLFSGKIYHAYGALTLVENSVYYTTASHCDIGAYYGSIVEINLVTQARSNTFFPTTPRQGGGIWGPGGLSTMHLPNGNLALLTTTGNAKSTSGSVSTNNQNFRFGNAIVKLSLSLSASEHFSAPQLVGDSDFGATPIFVNTSACPSGIVLAQNKNGALYSVFANNFTQVQSLTFYPPGVSDSFIGAPSFDPSLELVFLANPATGSISRGMVALSLDSKCLLSVKWATDVVVPGHTPFTPAVISGGFVFFGTGQYHSVFALNASTGAHVWNYTFPGGSAVFAPPIVSRGILLVGTWGGNLVAFQ